MKDRIAELEERNVFLESELEACRKKNIRNGMPDTKELEGWKDKVLKLQEELDQCKKSRSAVGASAVVPVAALAEEPVKKDDLKVVEGIGPKIESLCHAAGIYTFSDLANTSTETLKDILVNAGSRYQMHDPTTWPKQAALARDSKWDELKSWQDELNKGRE
ncbi:hypothetical protein LAG90_07780 [Marinilongibacter aquaticus]|uniref:hypothetical protein n=1 Tax=Marinilongibacter aquaticus TaxID=2975157 RepID=UPI0021BDB242|nr:hypothetical protein [Marinilongibacter aquaticus]UBM60540.1 hypothetical protein LAG90_07780 [Marinilongibacter aquaticus]